VLYWDEIGSIVPHSYDSTELIPYTPDVEFLKSEGEFRPFRPDLILQRGWTAVQEFENELVDIILSDEFQSMLAPIMARSMPARVHRDKVSDAVFNFLRDAELARTLDHDHDWYYFEEKTAFLYMAILAKYLADFDPHAATVLGTNIRAYEKLSFGTRSNSNSFDGLSLGFFNILPIPRYDNSLADILHFKRRRRDQLLRFRKVINEVGTTLTKCDKPSDVNDTLAIFGTELEIGLADLQAVLNDSKIATIAGSLEALVKTSSPGWLTTALVESGKVKNIADVPIKWAIGGTILAGTIGVAKYLVDRRNERRAAKRGSPFSYLYAAVEDAIL
jgi:hypothetical protein